MKSDRLLAVLLALQQAGKESASALAARLEVSVRTIYRDVDALAAAGVPISAERGSRGGIVLADGYRDALARFNEDEVRALFVSADDALTELGLRGGRRSALDKIARAMPRRARETLKETRGRVHVDSRRWLGVSSPPPALAALRDAVWNDRCVSIGYTDRSGTVTRRVLEPYGLVSKAGVWYLVGRDGETIKTFRVQRIARVRILDRRFTRPKTFDVGEYWKDVAAKGQFEERPYVATFRMSRTAMSHASAFLKVESRRRLRGRSPAQWDVRFAFPSFQAALYDAMLWSDEVLVLDAQLRTAIAERGRRLVARYGSASAPE